MYCWDCMRVKRAMFCCKICMRVYEFLWELLRKVLWLKLLKVWELLRFCDWSCWRCESCVQSKYSLHLRVVWEFFIVSLIFIEYDPKQTKLVQKGLRELFVACASLIYSLNMSQNRQSIWHDHTTRHDQPDMTIARSIGLWNSSL